MNMHTELESKFILTRLDYEALLAQCTIVRCVDQLNIYFDDGWLLAAAGATCRLRVASRLPSVFTLKLPKGTTRDGAKRSLEIEMPAPQVFVGGFSIFLSEIDRTGLIPEVRDALSPLNVERLVRVGRMRNRRYVMRTPNGDTFELDRFRLPGGATCYEVEVEESDTRKRQDIVTCVRLLAPSAEPSTMSKFQRFKEAAQRARPRASREARVFEH